MVVWVGIVWTGLTGFTSPCKQVGSTNPVNPVNPVKKTLPPPNGAFKFGGTLFVGFCASPDY
jgi:hypothetical protein